MEAFFSPVPSLFVRQGGQRGAAFTKGLFLRSPKVVFPGGQTFLMENTLAIFQTVTFSSPCQKHQGFFCDLHFENLLLFLEVEPAKMGWLL